MIDSLINGIYTITGFLWEVPIPILLLGMGLIMTISFKGKFILSVKFMWKNTLGLLFKKTANDQKGGGTISSWASGMTALASTIGTGNIAGVATAITMGGPGAVVWMWLSGLLGMSTKASEIILGQRYRIRYKSHDEYECDRPFVMRDAMGWKFGALLVATFCVLSGPWSNLTQSEALASSFHAAFGVPKWVVLAITGITLLIAMLGGLRRISQVAEKIVPFMGILYVVCCVGILCFYWRDVPTAFASIFKGAFTTTAAVGGFVGATMKDAMRYGLARGMYSNDAGTGLGIVLHAGAITDHPVRQACWGWGEIFVDTIVICTMTALTLICSGAYINHGDITSGELTTVAFIDVYGKWGGYLMAIILGLFVWTTILAIFYSCEKCLDMIVGDKKVTKTLRYIHIAYFLLPIIFLSTMQVEFIWALQDLISCAFIFITAILVFGNRKEIMRLFHDFFDRYIPAVERGENPDPIIYGEVVEDGSALMDGK